MVSSAWVALGFFGFLFLGALPPLAGPSLRGFLLLDLAAAFPLGEGFTPDEGFTPGVIFLASLMRDLKWRKIGILWGYQGFQGIESRHWGETRYIHRKEYIYIYGPYGSYNGYIYIYTYICSKSWKHGFHRKVKHHLCISIVLLVILKRDAVGAPKLSGRGFAHTQYYMAE